MKLKFNKLICAALISASLLPALASCHSLLPPSTTSKIETPSTNETIEQPNDQKTDDNTNTPDDIPTPDTTIEDILASFNDFVFSETDMPKTANDALIKALYQKRFLSRALNSANRISGQVNSNDMLYYCYFATDADGHVFFTDKMDATKPQTLQPGLSDLNSLETKISNKVLSIDNIGDYLYSTSSNTVGYGDIVSIFYFTTWQDGDAFKADIIFNEYFEVMQGNDISKAIIGLPINAMFPYQFTATVRDGGMNITKYISNIEIKHLIKDQKNIVMSGDVISANYAFEFDASPFYNASADTYDFGDFYNNINHEIIGGKYTATVQNELLEIVADPEGTDLDSRSFIGQLVHRYEGSTVDYIRVKNAVVNGQSVVIDYSNVKINWIVEKGEIFNPNEYSNIVIKHTPYPEALNADGSNKETVKDIYGTEITLNGRELTYYVFPIYYTDLADIGEDGDTYELAERILRNFYKTVISKVTTEDGVTEYVFSSLNKDANGNEYVCASNGKTLATLAEELAAYGRNYEKKYETLLKAYENLTIAQKNFANHSSDISSEELLNLKSAMERAEVDYNAAISAEQSLLAHMLDKVREILTCTKGDLSVKDAIVSDCLNYLEGVIS